MGIKRLLFEKSKNKYKKVSLNCMVIHFNKKNWFQNLFDFFKFKFFFKNVRVNCSSP